MARQTQYGRMAACALLAWIATTAPGGSAIVVPPTFEELIAEAETIFLGQVVDLRSEWEEARSGRAIVTAVTFKIIRTYKGGARVQTVLDFLGGTVGDDTLEISGMPRFAIGDRDVLFVNTRGRPISPLVGLMHGRFRVLIDAAGGLESVRTFNGSPIASVSQLGRPLARSGVPPPRVSMRLADFEREILEEVQRQSRQR